jgi:hypothetical protein
MPQTEEQDVTAGNVGIAEIEATILPNLPNIREQDTKVQFDERASNWRSYDNNPFIRPIYTGPISGDYFSAITLSKRKYHIDNFILGSAEEINNRTIDSDEPSITWTPIDPSTIENMGFINTLINSGDYGEWENYDRISPEEYLSNSESVDENYKGPFWTDINIERIAKPTDKPELAENIAEIFNIENEEEVIEEVPEENQANNRPKEENFQIYQKRSMDGLWYGVESNSFITTENTHFWININKNLSPPSFKNKTFFLISLNVGESEDQAFDIYLSEDTLPVLIDYKKGRQNLDKKVITEFKSDVARILATENEIEIGIMVVAGKLIIIVNNQTLVYTRYSFDENGEEGEENPVIIEECKIKPGSIRIYGTNVMARYSVSPMVFPKFGCISMRIPNEYTVNNEVVDLKYYGVDYEGELRGSVCKLPTDPTSSEPLYGCDCLDFLGDMGFDFPSGEFHQKRGYITIKSGKKFNPVVQDAKEINNQYFVMGFEPSYIDFSGKQILGGAPFYFRIKGAAEMDLDVVGNEGMDIDISSFIVSASVTENAPDYSYIERNANVTLYNRDGILNNLTEGQSGITISMGWNGDLKKIFTGIVTSMNTSQKAGEEYLILNCKDYMHILDTVLFVNSPFYDGMEMVSAVKEIAARGGIIKDTIQNDWDYHSDFFLKQGFSFSSPAMRFENTDTLLSGIQNIVKQAEATVYFDSDGILHVERLEGGLFSENPDVEFNFYSRPTDGDMSSTILDEKNITYDYNSTVNVINVLTVDRKSREPLIHNRTDPNSKLKFKKIFLYDQPALGGLLEAKDYVERLSRRIFFDIQKTGFKTIARPNNIGLHVLSFVTLDGQPFRIMSLKRNYNVASNDLTQDIEGEWLGGRGNI